jgi:hypothetical protein
MRFLVLVLLLAVVLSPASARGMTLDELSTAARYFIEEEAAYNFTSAEVTFYVNMAQRAVANMLADDAIIPLSEYATQSVSLTDYYNALPTGFMRVSNVALDGYIAKRKDISEIWSVMPNNKKGMVVSRTEPVYIIHNDGILVYPLPTTAGTLEVWYYELPTDLSTTSDECVYTTEVENLVAMMAAVYMLKKDHEFQKATELLNQINTEATLINAKRGVKPPAQ